MACINNLRNILITLRRLLHDQFRARYPNTYPLPVEIIEDVGVAELPTRLRSGLRPTGAVAGAAEGRVHPLLSSGEDVGTCAHCASYEYGLSCELVVHGDERVVGRESSSGAFAVDEESAELIIDDVLRRKSNADERIYCIIFVRTKLHFG